jgi:hypothetical protein
MVAVLVLACTRSGYGLLLVRQLGPVRPLCRAAASYCYTLVLRSCLQRLGASSSCHSPSSQDGEQLLLRCGMYASTYAVWARRYTASSSQWSAVVLNRPQTGTWDKDCLLHPPARFGHAVKCCTFSIDQTVLETPVRACIWQVGAQESGDAGTGCSHASGLRHGYVCQNIVQRAYLSASTPVNAPANS